MSHEPYGQHLNTEKIINPWILQWYKYKNKFVNIGQYNKNSNNLACILSNRQYRELFLLAINFLTCSQWF